MSTCKDLSYQKQMNEEDAATRYSRRLSYAALANKTQKTTIEKLRAELNKQSEQNKNLNTRLDRTVQLCNTRQILIKQLKDEINKVKNDNTEISEENKSLLDEIYSLRCSNKIKLSATQEDLIQASLKNQEHQEDLKKQITLLKQEVDSLRKELNDKERDVADFVTKTKRLLTGELVKLTKSVDEGAERLKIAEDKSKQLCKAIIKLLSLFHQRRIARRLVGGEMLPVSRSSLNKSAVKESSSTSLKWPGKSARESKFHAALYMEESTTDVKKEQVSISCLKDVIEKFHLLIHKSSFSDELGTFLFNNIVNPFLFQ